RLAAPWQATFVGLENYRLLVEDVEFHDAISNTLQFTGASVLLETLLGLGLALLLHRRFRGRTWLRAAALVPWAIPTIVSAQLWRFILNDVYGVANDIAVRLHLIDQPVAYLATPGIAMACVVLVDVWKTTPFMALLLLGALQGIPDELYEAARVDGANARQRFRFVTWPLLAPMLLVGMLFRTMDALRLFDTIYVLTLGAFGTESMATYNRRVLIDFRDLGYGSACSVAIFAFIGLVSAVYVWFVIRRERLF
ncbi:MAG: carbohydrate ABC transporter permease, partial [Candidatus Krumholzibacteriia bacterium]